MRRTSFADWPCPIARAQEVLGDPWTPLVLREAFYGTTRFDDFQRGLQIARNTLSDRLQRLVEHGLLERRRYEDEPPRYEYLLTRKGADFFGVLAAMLQWGNQWLAGDDGPPIGLTHHACGHDTHAEVVCAHCREPLRAADTTMVMGPCFPELLTQLPAVRKRFRLDPDPAVDRQEA